MDDIRYCHHISVADYNHLRESVGWAAIEESQVCAGLTNSSYLIADVIVLPEYQGRGIGKEMMARIMKHIRSGLKEGQKVMVSLMAAKDKEPFYEWFDFVRRPNETMSCGMVQWIYGEPQAETRG